MRTWWIALTFIACGGRTAPPVPVTEQVTRAEPFKLDRVPTPEQMCTRARELAAEQCPPFADWPAEMLDECNVYGAYASGAQACFLEPTCERYNACVDHVVDHGAPFRGPTSDCAGPELRLPAGVTAEEMADSYGRAASKYSAAPSTRTRPIEVCGIPEEAVYLMRATCDDGSRPFANFRKARQSRTGNVGAGGRCGRIIDRFVVKCPERDYEIFIDAYRCPARTP